MRRIIRMAFSSLGSPTCTTWKRRVRAGSFSMCFLYSAQVVAATVRSVPRARAGLSRLAASPVPAAPPAPISVWASSTNRMIGFSEACTSSITWRSRCSNSPFMLAPACNRPISSESSATSFNGGGTSPAAMRRAKPSTTAVLPTPASPVRIGLFWRRRMRISTIWRISSSRPTIGSISPWRARSVRSTANRRRASCLPIAAGSSAAGFARLRAAQLRAVRGGQLFLRRAADDLGEALGEFIGLDFLKLLGDAGQGQGQAAGLDHPDQQIAGAHLAVLEQQRAVDPAAFDRLLDVRRQIGDRGRAARQPVQRLDQVPGQPGRIEAEVLEDAVQIRIRQLQQLVQPMDQFHVRVAAQLAEHGGAFDGLIGDRIQFAEQGRTGDVWHGLIHLRRLRPQRGCTSGFPA